MAEASGQLSTLVTPKAAKDRNCPYCRQAFTSSSLGRHLDLYIKAKNPKQPDGIHNVDEIRKIRGNVTRRQARGTPRRSTVASVTTPAAGSQGSRASEDGESSTVRSPTSQRGPPPPTSRQDLEGWASANDFLRELKAQVGSGRPELKEDGTAEGSRAKEDPAGHLLHPTGRDTAMEGSKSGADDTVMEGSGQAQQRVMNKQSMKKHQLDVRQRIQDALDTTKAAELALRELIGSWRAAKQRIDSDSTPFDFDPLSLDFPALTLQCLEPPPTLFSSTQHSTSTSWSISPPGPKQLDALRAYFEAEFGKWKVTCAAATTAVAEELTYPPAAAAFRIDTKEAVRKAEEAATKLENQVYDHIQSTFDVWIGLPEGQRTNLWVLELARGVGRKQKQIDRLTETNSAVTQENANLKAQVEQLSRLQQPREFKVAPPSTLYLEPKLVRHLQEEAVVHGKKVVGLNIGDRHSDLNTIVSAAIERWKNVVVSVRTSSAGLQAQRSLSQANPGGSPLPAVDLSVNSGQQHGPRRSPSYPQYTPALQSPPLSQPPSATIASALMRGASNPVATPGPVSPRASRVGIPVAGNSSAAASISAEVDEGPEDAEECEDNVDADAEAEGDTDADADADADAEMEDDDYGEMAVPRAGTLLPPAGVQQHPQHTRHFLTMPVQQTAQLEVARTRTRTPLYPGIGSARAVTHGGPIPQHDNSNMGRLVPTTSTMQGVGEGHQVSHDLNNPEPIAHSSMGGLDGMTAEPMYID